MKLATIKYIHELLKREVETCETEMESLYETLVKVEKANYYSSKPDIKRHEALLRQYEEAKDAFHTAALALEEFENKDF